MLLRDIDVLMATNAPLPVGHPSIDRYVCSLPVAQELNGYCPVTFSDTHPDVDAALNGSEPFPVYHIKVHAPLVPFMPASHR